MSQSQAPSLTPAQCIKYASASRAMMRRHALAWAEDRDHGQLELAILFREDAMFYMRAAARKLEAVLA